MPRRLPEPGVGAEHFASIHLEPDLFRLNSTAAHPKKDDCENQTRQIHGEGINFG
jgi:hypothetical protein